MKRNLIFTLVIWLLIIGLLETGARSYDYIRNAGQETPEYTSDPAAIFLPHPYTTYAANPDNPNHNAQGYRAAKNRSYGADPGVINVVAMGGSSTYGTRVHTAESYPFLLEEILRRSTYGDKEINVINAGLGGYSTPNLVSLLAGKIVHLKPSVIIFYVGFNDAWTRLMFSDFQTDYSHAQKSWGEPDFPLWRHSRFLDLVAELAGYPQEEPHIHSVAWKKMSGDPDDNLRNSSTEAFRSNLVTLIAISRAHGATPVLVTQATDFRQHPLPQHNKPWMRAMKEHTDVLKQVAGDMSVDLIDIRSLMTDRQEYFLDVLHMNGRGNRKRAEIIAGYLIQNDLLGEHVRETETATREVISKYMRLQRADIFVQRVLKYKISELRKSGMQISSDDEDRIIGMFSDFDNVIAVYAPVYENISQEALIKANRFFDSELGRRSVSSYVRGRTATSNMLTEDEVERLKTYRSSDSWQEIERKRPYINRDAMEISERIIKKFKRTQSLPSSP